MIDWFTTLAQIVNFLILVGLLRYFLYGRVLAVMQQRQTEIARRWAEAERARQEAQEALVAAEEERRGVEQQRAELLERIRREVEAYRQQMLKDVRRQVDQQRQQWLDALAADRQAFLRGLQKTVVDQVTAIAGRALRDLADAELEKQMVAHFLTLVDSLPAATQQAIVQMVIETEGELVVETTLDLNADARDEIVARLTRLVRSDAGAVASPEASTRGLQVRFVVNPELICGLALRTPSFRIGWSLRDYMEDIHRELHSALDEELKSIDVSQDLVGSVAGDGDRSEGGEAAS